MHWNRSTCDYVQFTDEQIEMITGLLMGDGDLHGRTDPNPHFRLRMTNREFLLELDSNWDVLSTGVFLDRSAEDQYESEL